MQAQLFDTPYQGDASNVKESHVWSPQDRLNGHTVVTGAKVDAVSISLLGERTRANIGAVATDLAVKATCGYGRWMTQRTTPYKFPQALTR